MNALAEANPDQAWASAEEFHSVWPAVPCPSLHNVCRCGMVATYEASGPSKRTAGLHLAVKVQYLFYLTVVCYFML